MSDNERKYCVMIGPGVFVVEKWSGRTYGSPDDIPKCDLITYDEAWDIVNAEDCGTIFEVFD